jgi:plasmid stability protein
MMRYARIMKRTTVMLPDDVEALLRIEARRRGVPVAAVVREAVTRHLREEPGPRRLSFVALGEAGVSDGSERVDEHVAAALRRRGAR